MKFYKFKYLTLAAVMAVSVMSCKKDFGDTNVNPNAPLTPSTKFLFGSAVTGIRGIMNAAPGLLYVQHMAEYVYTNRGISTLNLAIMLSTRVR